MEFKELKDKAIELLEPLEQRYYATLSDVHWVRQDNNDIEGDFCEHCIDKAVKNAKKSLKEKRQKVIAKFKEIEETDAEIKKAIPL